MTGDMKNRANPPRIGIEHKRRVVRDEQPQTSRSRERRTVKRSWHSRPEGNGRAVGAGDSRDRYEGDKPEQDGKGRKTQGHDLGYVWGDTGGPGSTGHGTPSSP
jgi:hypothetical protein